MAGGSFTCPVDGSPLSPMERQGIEIDFCPTCRGVWLDRGELDKIIERSAAQAAPAPAPSPWPEPGYRDPRHAGDRHHHPHKKRKSFFEELFD
ncbi:zf-TFIIB domain-containing protein [Sphingomonas sp. IC-56]|uniref:TFIIB-type zinc ribbon-containing protein n=1 Tax=Sphingomonas sp. IC-56 TaxID=2898529 RepID=UPI001E347626|nr:zf-TFIIB domain-containing protein [Sphingomonas sp. IC-56]MCD2325399.1 zf-TFIIB domain-containing protein [Sphingomonas sp. IC-56]